MKLTAQQAKMVIEYLSKIAAEDKPVGPAADCNKHDWMTQYEASLAVERRITPLDWADLLMSMEHLQSFDRDPEGFMNDRGFAVLTDKDNLLDYLKDQVSWHIDNCYNNSGA